MLAIRDDGLLEGSVSGGCIEDDLIRQIRDGQLVIDTPRTLTYGVSAQEARKFGLPCGGTLELVLEVVKPHSQIDAMIEAIEAGVLFTKQLNLATGVVQILDQHLGFTCDDTQLRLPLGPAYRVLVIGAGQLSKFFSQIMLGLGFKVTVCDPRQEYYDNWDIAGVELTREMPDDVVLSIKPDARTAIVALTHDPKLDDLALLEALNSQAFYVAALGSTRNNQQRKQRLQEHFGMSDEALARLHGPAGLFIGSKIPSEIAVSIAAELVAAKNRVLAVAGVISNTSKKLELTKVA
jgi:xanthine dehydrogenase accessory factor